MAGMSFDRKRDSGSVSCFRRFSPEFKVLSFRITIRHLLFKPVTVNDIGLRVELGRVVSN